MQQTTHHRRTRWAEHVETAYWICPSRDAGDCDTSHRLAGTWLTLNRWLSPGRKPSRGYCPKTIAVEIVWHYQSSISFYENITNANIIIECFTSTVGYFSFNLVDVAINRAAFSEEPATVPRSTANPSIRRRFSSSNIDSTSTRPSSTAWCNKSSVTSF